MNTTVTLVTGPFRSGTSMLTGLLESCGYDLGRTYPVMRKPDRHNPLGHLEIEYVVMLNSYILLKTVPDDVYSSWFPLPGIPDYDHVTEYCAARDSYFRRFVRDFDGELCKDPHFCLTLSAWRQYWKNVKTVIFCLRDPKAAAESIGKRYGLPFETALEVWYGYAAFFRDHFLDDDTRIFDLSAFYEDPPGVLRKLLEAVGRSVGDEVVEKAIRERWRGDFIHKAARPNTESLPRKIADLYGFLAEKGKRA